VSEATVSRLPVYLAALVELPEASNASVSSDGLAELSGVNAATVRRDLASLGITGTRGVGYDVGYVLHEIGVELGVNEEWPVIIVGAGNLGRALANYPGLATRGFPVRAVVDVDSQLVGSQIGDLVVRHADEMAEIVSEFGVGVAVIATPPHAAQAVAEKLIGAGVESLLNFTAQMLTVPESVQVRGVDLATELQILSFYQQRTSAARSGTGVPLALGAEM
jgi:redox-sensing transcriptional repressor